MGRIGAMTAAIWTYWSAFISGVLDPTWPHIVLLSGSIICEVAVAIGILLEQHWPKCIKEWIAVFFVIGGVFFGVVCTVLLFVFDEGISHAQNDKVISLENRIAYRKLRAFEFNSVLFGRQDNSVIVKIYYFRGDRETLVFAEQLFANLQKSMWVVKIPIATDAIGGPPPALIVDQSGSMATEPGSHLGILADTCERKTACDVISRAFAAAGIAVDTTGTNAVPKNTLRIFISPRL